MKIKILKQKTYAGRPIGVESILIDAKFECKQQDGTTVVILEKPVFGYPAGHRLAILPQFIIEQ
jgi:hypothetical protein